LDACEEAGEQLNTELLRAHEQVQAALRQTLVEAQNKNDARVEADQVKQELQRVEAQLAETQQRLQQVHEANIQLSTSSQQYAQQQSEQLLLAQAEVRDAKEQLLHAHEQVQAALRQTLVEAQNKNDARVEADQVKQELQRVEAQLAEIKMAPYRKFITLIARNSLHWKARSRSE